MTRNLEDPCIHGDLGMCNECYSDYKVVSPKGEHTPTPWNVAKARVLQGREHWTIETKNGRNTPVSAILKEEDAAFIVRAVNSHEELLEALIAALPYVETALEDQGYKPGVVDRMTRQIRAAIAKAEHGGK